MRMGSQDRKELLARWVAPSSNSEQQRQDRAVRMIKNAITAHESFNDTSIKVYAKGSYANNTNVRLDSDVDVVVENHSCQYYEYFGDFERPVGSFSRYEGPWNPENWRKEVLAALRSQFGSSDVDSTGEIALVISELPGSRPSADVVPSFKFERFDDPQHRTVNVGSKVFKKSGGYVVNWPQQQLDNGRAKNEAWFGTAGRYKKLVRVLKNAENFLAENGTIKALPSYLMECLVWNVPNSEINRGVSHDTGFRATLEWLAENLDSARYSRESWEEPNGLKYLFGDYQKWSVVEARNLVTATWDLLEY